MENELRAGVIGMGVMGMLHAGTINSFENVSVVAIADPEKLVMKFIQKFMPNVKAYAKYSEMLESENLDFVYITTPVQLHVEIATKCAKKRIPFFVEKPLSRTATECNELSKILSENYTINMVGFNLRYSNTFRKAKELLDENHIGKILNVKSTAFRTLEKKGTGWRFKKESSGGGVLIDIGIHLVDLLMYFFGDIKSTHVKDTSFCLPEIEDSVSATLTFENEINCDFQTSWNVKNYRLQETTIEIIGKLGKIVVSEDFVKIQKTNSQKEIFYKQSLYKGVDIDIGGPMYTKEDEDFVKSIHDQNKVESDVFNSIKVQTVIDSIYKSIKDEGKVTINHVK